MIDPMLTLSQDASLEGVGRWGLGFILLAMATLGLLAVQLRDRLGGAAVAGAPARGSLRDPARQIAAVARVDFERRPLLAREETAFLNMIEAAVGELAPAHRVLARVSLDDVVSPVSADAKARGRATASIRSKRLDFAILDAQGRIVAALGWQDRALQMGAARDRVRRKAMARAGVPYIDLSAATSAESLCQALDEALDMAPASA